jgi:hypothetical protein
VSGFTVSHLAGKMQESSSPRASLTGSRLAPNQGLRQTGIGMTDAARMKLLEDHKATSTERFDSLEARLSSLADGNSRMENLLQSVLTARIADATIYANITALQQEVVADKTELDNLTSPSPTGLARLRSSAISLASTTKRTALTLLNNGVSVVKIRSNLAYLLSSHPISIHMSRSVTALVRLHDPMLLSGE